MIIADTKWGTELYETAFGLLKQRLDDGFYYDNWDDGDRAHQWEDRARAIVELPTEDGGAMREKRAWAFLLERSEFEYEWIEVGSVQ